VLANAIITYMDFYGNYFILIVESIYTINLQLTDNTDTMIFEDNSYFGDFGWRINRLRNI